jgi:hypothetical protein
VGIVGREEGELEDERREWCSLVNDAGEGNGRPSECGVSRAPGRGGPGYITLQLVLHEFERELGSSKVTAPT